MAFRLMHGHHYQDCTDQGVNSWSYFFFTKAYHFITTIELAQKNSHIVGKGILSGQFFRKKKRRQFYLFRQLNPFPTVDRNYTTTKNV